MKIDLQEALKLRRVRFLYFRHYMHLPVTRPGRFISQEIFL